MTNHAPFTVTVPGMGIVKASFTDATTISAQADYGLLWDGLLYSINATLGLHDGVWYPVSGVVITGKLGKNAPKKVGDPIGEAVTFAINNHIAINPEIVAQARQAIYDSKTKSLEGSVEYQQKYLDRNIKDVEAAKAALAKHLEATP